MILNTSIWSQTITTAKAAASNNSAWLRAIERAVIEIEKASYWSFDGSTLAIISTTSKKLYKINDNHTCEARGGICKHRAARRLMVRYTERLNASPERERAVLISSIKTAWVRRFPGESPCRQSHGEVQDEHA